MNSELDLPPEVIAEINANRIVTAIKLLREKNGIGLTEAKLAVDNYARKHAVDTSHQSRQPPTGFGPLIVIVLAIGLAIGLYQYFS